jgi:hypothetical protein
MKARTRRIIEMSNRVLRFSQAHPDPSPGYAAALARLEKSLAEVDEIATRQLAGINQVRSATAKKRELRRKMRRTHLVHLARVAEAASKEAPNMARTFALPREGVPYLAFRTATRGMLAAAQNQKDLLVKHGLLDSVLASLAEALGQFDEAIVQGTDGRRIHVGASSELDEVADELSQVVRLMDGSNRYRLAEDTNSLAEWESSSNTFGPPRSAVEEPTSPDTPPQGGEIKPAA